MSVVSSMRQKSTETLQEWLARLLKVDQGTLTPDETDYLVAYTNLARATIRVEQLEKLLRPD
jgi:hypothetical protein